MSFYLDGNGDYVFWDGLESEIVGDLRSAYKFLLNSHELKGSGSGELDKESRRLKGKASRYYARAIEKERALFLEKKKELGG